MNIGDLVRIGSISTSHGAYDWREEKIGMIVEGPNEVGKIRVLFSNGQKLWLHSSDVEYMPKEGNYLKQ